MTGAEEQMTLAGVCNGLTGKKKTRLVSVYLNYFFWTKSINNDDTNN